MRQADWVHLATPIVYSEMDGNIPDDHICFMTKHAVGVVTIDNVKFSYTADHKPTSEKHRVFVVTITHDGSGISGASSGFSPKAVSQDAVKELAKNLTEGGILEA